MILEMPNRTWLPVCILLAVCCVLGFSEADNRVVCYYTNWSVYRPGTAKFNPQNINPYLCTHLIYAFGGFTKENTLKPFDKYQDIEKGGYAKFTGLKTYNKNLKTMLAIGGWNEGSSRFSPMVASADRRKELVKNAIKFLRQNHFDGLDLDWEYPSFRDGGKPRDRDNYAQLVQELREEFDRESQKTGRPRLLLTMAVPAGVEYVNKGYDIPKLTKYLDWMNILSYDYHSAFEPAVNHHAPLYSLEEDSEYNYDADLNIDHTIKYYLEAGAEKNKLVLGIPTYGRSYTLFNPEANEIGAPADGPGDMGEATRENGYLAYYEICENVKDNGWEVIQPNPKAMGPYAYKENQWVGYDDIAIVRKKAEYVAEQGLGGIMFWAIDNDDFRGNCHGKPYPLIEAAKEALMTSAGRTDDNLVSNALTPSKSRSRSRGRSTTSRPESPSRTVQNSGGRQSVSADEETSRKRIRIGTRFKVREDAAQEEVKKTNTRQRNNHRRRRPTTTATTTVSTTPSTLPTTPSYRTPEPPTTPDPGSDFKCEDEGFFPHPRDCKKYFWCLSSGPSELGIIAHQFTCPSGLYFNKAADSCDYTQNVLCNKKLSRVTSAPTSTTGSTTTTTPTPSTTRKPPRITAATSRTTYAHTTTTTPAPEYEEYEYDDLEEEDRLIDSEEDPRVIKELIDLIKKVGGVEELEKFLKIQEDGAVAVTKSDSTTPSAISRSLYERVLSKASVTNSRDKLYTTLNRNSRPGPQNAGLDKEKSEEGSRQRPQYITIQRQRGSTEAPNDDDEEEIEEEVSERTSSRQTTTKKSAYPEYVSIRRTRPTTTEEPEITSSSTQSIRQRIQNGDEASATEQPEYVTIRRQRVTTEETTSKYTTILRRRPTTQSQEEKIETSTATETTIPTTTAAQSEKPDRAQLGEGDYLSVAVVYSTDATPTSTESVLVTTTPQDTTQSPSTTERSNQIDDDTEPSIVTTTTSQSTSLGTPQLYRPRPFTTRSRSTTAKPSTESPAEVTTRKVSFARPSVRNPTVKPSTRPPTPAGDDSQDATPRFNSRGSARFRLSTTTARTESIQRSPEIEYDYEEQYQRTFRPQSLADLSSLTSADIEFRNNQNRRQHRRPTTEATTTVTTEPSIKTGPRTLTIARKLIAENIENRSNRKITRPKLEQSDDLSAKNTQFVRPRPLFNRLARTSPRPSVSDADSASEATKFAYTFTVSTPTPFTTSTEAAPSIVDDNEQLQSDNELKTTQPDDESTENSVYSQNAETENSIDITTDDKRSDTTIGNVPEEITTPAIRHQQTDSTISVTQTQTTSINPSTRRFAGRRSRPTTTTPIPVSTEESTERQRGRLPYVLIRNQTRQRPGQATEQNLVRRIRPVVLRKDATVDEDIKLSESSVRTSEDRGRVQNLPEDDSGKVSRRKIIKIFRINKNASKTDGKEIKVVKDEILDNEAFADPAIKRTRKVIRKFNQTDVSDTDKVLPRRKKIIRIWPTSTTEATVIGTRAPPLIHRFRQETTTENFIVTSEETVADEATTTEAINTEAISTDSPPTEAEPEEESTTVDDMETTTFEESETTVTTEATTTTRRPTRPSLIGKPRPYRPRNRLTALSSTTTTTPKPRRRFGSFNRGERPKEAVEEQEVKKVYNKRLRYTPIARSTTESIRAAEPELHPQEDVVEDEITTREAEGTTTISALVDLVTRKLDIDNEIDPTEEISTEALAGVTSTTEAEMEMTTFINQAETTYSVTDTTLAAETTPKILATTTEPEEESDTLTTTTDSEVSTTTTIYPTTITTESAVANETPTESLVANETTTESLVANETTTESVVANETTTKSTVELVRPRYRPKFVPNQAETDNNELDKKKFTPSRAAERNRLAFRLSLNKPTEVSTTSETPLRKFIPTGRKIQGPRFPVNTVVKPEEGPEIEESPVEESPVPEEEIPIAEEESPVEVEEKVPIEEDVDDAEDIDDEVSDEEETIDGDDDNEDKDDPEISTDDKRKSNLPVDSRTSIRPQNRPQNRPPYVPKRPTANVPINRPFSNRFNNPSQATPTPETLAGINVKAVNERNKNLFSKNRKMNVPIVASSTAKAETPALETTVASQTTAAVQDTTIEQATDRPTTLEEGTTTEGEASTESAVTDAMTEDSVVSESTTEQLSTLHHIFAEVDATTESSDALEKLIEVNRIVEVSLKEDKANSSGVYESRFMQEPTFDRVGAINRVTIIKVVDGGDNETSSVPLPANHAPRGQRLEVHSEPANVEEHLHAPNIQQTKQNILNNTLQIIESLSKQGLVEVASRGTVVTGNVAGDELTRFLPLGKQTVSFSREVSGADDTPGVSKIEIYSRSNVIDYSNRDPMKSASGPVFTDATTISLEGLFPRVTTDLPTLKQVVTGAGDDLQESHSTNGRVRIRILGQDLEEGRSNAPKAEAPLAPIRLLSEEDYEPVMRADVVEVPATPSAGIRIAPLAVRVESSRAFSTSQSVGVPTSA